MSGDSLVIHCPEGLRSIAVFPDEDSVAPLSDSCARNVKSILSLYFEIYPSVKVALVTAKNLIKIASR